MREVIAMNDTVDVIIPVEPEAARFLANPETREAAGHVLSGLLRGASVRDVVAEALADVRKEVRANGATDEAIDAEIAAWRAERPVQSSCWMRRPFKRFDLLLPILHTSALL